MSVLEYAFIGAVVLIVLVVGLGAAIGFVFFVRDQVLPAIAAGWRAMVERLGQRKAWRSKRRDQVSALRHQRVRVRR